MPILMVVKMIADWRRSVQARQTDLARWTDAASYPDYWEPRAVLAGELLRPFGWVCDIGCGAQALRRHLASGTRYMPADLRQWTPETELCELNLGRLPVCGLARCDVAVLLGVIEYIFEPALLLERLSVSAEHLLISYCAPELWEVDRAGFGWVNALGAAELTQMLAQAGYGVRHQAVFEGRQLVMLASARRFGRTARLRRMLARLGLSSPGPTGWPVTGSGGK